MSYNLHMKFIRSPKNDRAPGDIPLDYDPFTEIEILLEAKFSLIDEIQERVYSPEARAEIASRVVESVRDFWRETIDGIGFSNAWDADSFRTALQRPVKSVAEPKYLIAGIEGYKLAEQEHPNPDVRICLRDFVWALVRGIREGSLTKDDFQAYIGLELCNVAQNDEVFAEDMGDAHLSNLRAAAELNLFLEAAISNSVRIGPEGSGRPAHEAALDTFLIFDELCEDYGPSTFIHDWLDNYNA